MLTPNVRTSGGARWNILASWGAAMRGKTSASVGDPEAATQLLSAVLRNVRNTDAGARESLLNFVTPSQAHGFGALRAARLYSRCAS